MKNILPLLIIGIICYISFFVHLNVLPPDIMEARNFVTAREMLEYNNWVVPTMNGEVRLTKPPLPTWLTALSAKWGGGINDYTALRFPAAAAAALMVFFFYGLVKTFTRDRLLPLIASAVLGTSLYIVFMGRNGSWDIFCHSFMLAALWAMSYGWNRKSAAYSFFLLAGIAMGLSFMSKGPVSFYTLWLPFFISYVVSFGFNKIRTKWKEGLMAVGVCVLISGAWPLYVVLTVPDELTQVIATESTAWVERHVRPFWFYWNFPIQIGLWTFFVIVALIFPYAKKRIDHYGKYTFIMGWLLLTILLLTLVPEKKDKYLLPAIVPMALATSYLIRYLIEAFNKNKQDKWDILILKINTIIVALASFGIPVFLYFYILPEGNLSIPLFITYALLFSGLALAMFYLHWKRRVLPLFVSYLILMEFFLFFILPYIPSVLINNPDYRNPKQMTAMENIQQMELYSMEETRIELIWAAGRKVENWEYKTNKKPLKKLPIAVFSRRPLKTYFPETAKDSLIFTTIDKYDINRGKSKKAYFIVYLSVIKEK